MLHTTQSQAPVQVFFSYSHKDEALRDELEEHLALLKRQGDIAGWHDRAIFGGQEWADQISEHLESARIILLLVSSSFLASDYCFGKEMGRALERHEKGEATVIPVIVRPCDWHEAPFAKLQSLPRDAKAVTIWANKDEAWTDVAKGIRRAVGAMTSERSVSPTHLKSERIGEQSRSSVERAGESATPDSLISPTNDLAPVLLNQPVERLTTTEKPEGQSVDSLDTLYLAAATQAEESRRRGELTHDDIENIRSQVWKNADNLGHSSATCPIDGVPMRITLNTYTNHDADITAHCVRHGLIPIKKETDPLRSSFQGKEWAEHQVKGMIEISMRGRMVHCPVCGTVVRSNRIPGFILLQCLRCGRHAQATIR